MRRNYNYKNEFSNNLKRLLRQNGMTQSELAMLINCGTLSISLYVNNKVFPSFENLLKISNVFSISIDELVVRPKTDNYIIERKR